MSNDEAVRIARAHARMKIFLWPLAFLYTGGLCAIAYRLAAGIIQPPPTWGVALLAFAVIVGFPVLAWWGLWIGERAERQVCAAADS